MSARIRHIKRRIRDLEHFLANTADTIAAYERVILDLPYLEAEKLPVRRRLAWHVERRAAIIQELARENELLACMPTNLNAPDYDPGDEQGYRDEKAKVRT